MLEVVPYRSSILPADSPPDLNGGLAADPGSSLLMIPEIDLNQETLELPILFKQGALLAAGDQATQLAA
ncbi:MAG: hypothetical protein K1X83_11925 [Oligoflexia bacterium]|nr:hypothetical protein [Oligoflexia bacterium]